MLASLRHPRKRTVSIGAQSEADAHEAIAYRESRRKDSVSAWGRYKASSLAEESIFKTANGHVEQTTEKDMGGTTSVEFTKDPNNQCINRSKPKTTLHNNGVGNEEVLVLPTPDATALGDSDIDREAIITAEEDREMFRKLYVPRVRYDVEVITKLVVYTGMQLF